MHRNQDDGRAGEPSEPLRARRRGQGELEALVLTVLRHSPGPATAAWVQQHLGGDLAYTTVVTILTRLHAKRAVARSRSGRSYLWTPTADEAGLAALRMRRVLDGERDRGAVLSRFVSALSTEDERLLRTLLEQVGEETDSAGTPPGAAGRPAPGRGAPPGNTELDVAVDGDDSGASGG